MCLHAVCKSIGRPPSSPKEVQEKGASKEQVILDAVFKGEQAVGHEYLKVWTQSIPKHAGTIVCMCTTCVCCENTKTCFHLDLFGQCV